MPPKANRISDTTESSTSKTSELQSKVETSAETTTVLGRQVARDTTVIPKEERPRKKNNVSEERMAALKDPLTVARLTMGKARAVEVRRRLLEGESLADIEKKPPALNIDDFVAKIVENRAAKASKSKPSVVENLKRECQPKKDSPPAPRRCTPSPPRHKRTPEGRQRRKPKVVYLSDSDSSTSSDDSREVIFKKKKKTHRGQRELPAPAPAPTPAPVKMTALQQKKMQFLNDIMNGR